MTDDTRAAPTPEARAPEPTANTKARLAAKVECGIRLAIQPGPERDAVMAYFTALRATVAALTVERDALQQQVQEHLAETTKNQPQAPHTRGKV